MIYLISYESNELLHDYSEAIRIIKSLGEYQHPMTTLWFVKSDTIKEASEIYRKLRPCLRERDHLFVVEVSQATNRQGWLSKIFWQWLRMR